MGAEGISIRGLSYAYGRDQALSELSLTIAGTQIVGLLGPNGAGKSTLMRLLTGYLPVAQGAIEIYGTSIGPRTVRGLRRIVGYLPERNPLYEEMYVRELLSYSGRLYGLRGVLLKKRIEETIERCGLAEVAKKRIEHLSKGYRQRVGLARSILHHPRLLILDEATSGLDPNQLVSFRQLLRDLSSEVCILFSTHVLQEIEELCDEVLLLNRGHLLIQSSLSGFKSRYQHRELLRVAFEGPLTVEQSALLEEIEGLDHLEVVTRESYLLYPKGASDLRASLDRYCEAHQLSIRSLETERPSLEQIFKQLTQTSPI